MLIYLTLPIGHSLPVESTPQTDFENTQDEDVDETSRKGFRTQLIYSIFLITAILMKINKVAPQTRKVTWN